MKSLYKYLIICIVLIIVVFVFAACSREMTGSGTEEDPFVIDNFEHLEQVGRSEDYPLNAYYILNENIDASLTGEDEYNDGKGWQPIGEYRHWNDYDAFTGVFDGQGYKIENLNINRPSEEVVGFISFINDGEIKNLGFDNLELKAKRYTGGIAGMNSGLISQSYVEGNITGEWQVGGITGWNFRGTIEDSFADTNVVAFGKAGGLVGENGSAAIRRSYATGSIKGEDWNVGGLTGSNEEMGIIEQSYAIAEVESYERVGGLTGLNRGTIRESYAAGTVISDWLVGGLVGWNFKGSISRSYWDLDIVDIANNDGMGRSSEEMKTRENYEDWDFDDVWTIENGYPVFQWQLNSQ